MKDKIKKVLLIFSLYLIIAPSSVFALQSSHIPPAGTVLQANYTDMWVAAQSGLNFRLLPSLDADIIKTLSYGTKVQVIQFDYIPGWDLVIYKNKVGYTSHKYLSDQQIDSYYLGSYRITFYCSCAKCNGKWAGQPTASGTGYTQGVTIATGPEFSFGTKLSIGGHIYTVQDRGVPNGCIDIYLDSHSECYSRGLYYTDVYLVQ